ncbi:MAG: hypothetical protein H0X39_00925 [Actinobacteria bacterium]|nr:hypothetical protein [Actinomycetota bacterium]
MTKELGGGDDSRWKAILAAVGKPRRKVRVGVFDDGGLENGVSIAEIAAFHEFGTSTIPERSFLRSTFYGHGADGLKAMCAKLVAAIIAGKMDETQALGLLGTWAAAEVKKTIRSNIAPALAPETIARKGSSVALVDTGQLINAITFAVED